MKLIKETEALIPEWAIPYLEYGEDGSLTPEDMAEVDAWVEALHADGFTSPTFDYDWDAEESGFHWHPEFGLGTGCVYTHVYQFVP